MNTGRRLVPGTIPAVLYSHLQVKSKGEALPTSLPVGKAKAGDKATFSPVFSLLKGKEVKGASTLLLTCLPMTIVSSGSWKSCWLTAKAGDQLLIAAR